MGQASEQPRYGQASRLTGQAMKALDREAAERTMVTLIELQKSTTQIGKSVKRRAISHALPSILNTLSYSEIWWWQHSAAWILLFSRKREAGQS